MKTPAALLPLHSTALGLILWGAATGFAAQVTDNLVGNGDFSTDTQPWLLRVANTASVFATLVRNDAGEASVLVVNGGGSKAAVMLQQPVAAPLVKDAVYLISFDVRSDEPKTIDVVFRGADKAILGGIYNLQSEPALTRHTVTYTHTRADALGVSLAFRIGGNNIPVAFDNIVLTRQPAAPAAQLALTANGAAAPAN